MKNLFIVFGFLVISISGLTQEAFAGKTCSICQVDTEEKVMTCAKGHHEEQSCVVDAINHHENILHLEANGMPCCGDGCKENFTITQIRDLLEPVERLALDERLAKAKAPAPENKPKTETQVLIEGIEAAFNLCCPKCGGTLDQIEGCNAATCSNEKCESKFCYLCLKPQESTEAAHKHVREHSGNYWEQRPGFADRYKWILIRKNLAELFSKNVPENVRNEALKARKDLLKANNMWPMPAVLTSSQWVEKVGASNFSKETKIKLFQNESIYRKQLGDLENAAIVETELKKIGGKVLASLDVEDTIGPVNQEVNQNNAITPLIAGDPDPRVAALLDQLQQEVPEYFAHGGNEGRMYVIQDPRNEVPPFVLSDEVGRVNHYEAPTLCPAGSTLPDRVQLEAFERAMSPNGIYDRRFIPFMRGAYIWSSVVHPDDPDSAFFFDGSRGNLFGDIRSYGGGSVRCVRQVAGW